jgi:hypothetical protein
VVEYRRDVWDGNKLEEGEVVVDVGPNFGD